ncbi:MAG: hypothetical protein U9R03_04430 [Candidatus Aerophobetes bacterium]|nr:hypothetical protein [Candidatus Aerophobetes bacterium]
MALNQLESYYNYIIPQTLKNNSTIMTLLELYFKNNNKIDVTNPVDLLNLDFLADNMEEVSKNKIRRELLKIHLQEIYDTLEYIGNREDIYERFKEIYNLLGLPEEEFIIAMDIEDSINAEYIASARSFKSKKGTKAGFFFVYDLINKTNIQKISDDDHFKLIEGTLTNPQEPYVYRVESSLYKEVYDATVMPLAHPIGFEYLFSMILFLILEDNYNYVEEIKLLKLEISCYNYDENGNKVVTTRNMNDGSYGTFNKFYNHTDSNKKEKVVIDFNPIQQHAIDNGYYGIRFVRDYNGTITIYTRQDDIIIEDGEFEGEHLLLEIEEIELIEDTYGIINKDIIEKNILGEPTNVIERISYKEYTIINKDNLKVRFKIKGDNLDKWNYSTLNFNNKSVSADPKFFNQQWFTRKEILDGCIDYNGRIIEGPSNNCQIAYDLEYIHKLAIEEIKNTIEKNSIEEEWTRKKDFDNIGFWIGEQIHDPSQIIINQEPFIGSENEDNEGYILGYENERKVDHENSEFGKWEEYNTEKQSLIPDGTNVMVPSGGLVPENEAHIAWEKYSKTITVEMTPSKEHFEAVMVPLEIGTIEIGNDVDDSTLKAFKDGVVRAQIEMKDGIAYFTYDDIQDGIISNYIGYSIIPEYVNADVVNFQYITEEIFIDKLYHLDKDKFEVVKTEKIINIDIEENITKHDGEYTLVYYKIGEVIDGIAPILGSYTDKDVDKDYKFRINTLEYVKNRGSESFSNIYFDNTDYIKNLVKDEMTSGIYRNGVLVENNNISAI